MTVVLNLLGFVVSVVLAWLFSGLLGERYLGGYELAVSLSLGILSAFSTLLFGSLLLGEAARWWHDHQRLAPAQRPMLASRHSLLGIAADFSAQPIPRPRLPQSEFARRWGQRKALAYEQILRECRAQGEQRPYRLKCSELNRLRLRQAGAYPRPAGAVRWRR